MGKAALIIMAAGIGSRFGGGKKQLEPVGPGGEIIMDYSIYDALGAGFDKVVFVIRKDMEQDFKNIIGKRIEKIVQVEYAYQEVSDIPELFKEKFKDRIKPWGTGQAILCCKDIIHEPFVVINADDYYGREAFEKAFQYLTAKREENEYMVLCMIGFILGNTLSENGGVTRGICKVNQEGLLEIIVETHNIQKKADGTVVCGIEEEKEVDIDSVVSMNMWGGKMEFFDILDEGFNCFLENIGDEDLKSEYLLPTIIGGLVEKNEVKVQVLQSSGEWFGMTYKEDKNVAVETIQRLIANNLYPDKLFT